MTMTGPRFNRRQMMARESALKDLCLEGSEVEKLRAENTALKQEISELRRFRALAYCDPLTGLRNRRYMEQRLQEEIGRAHRNADAQFSLVFVDVDDFKQVNDSMGHSEGDRTLCWVARVLEDALREHDVCCRLGGDEFALLLPETDAAGAMLLVRRLKQELKMANQKRSVEIRLSFGTATWPEHGGSASGLMAAADKAMYQDKANRKQRSAEQQNLTRRSLDSTLPWTGPARSSEPESHPKGIAPA